MKSNPAIVYLLWPKNSGILDAYLEKTGPRTILTSSYHICDELRGITKKHGASIYLIDDTCTLARKQALMKLSDDIDSKMAVYASDTHADKSQITTPAIASSLSSNVRLFTKIISGLDELANEHAIELVLLNEDWMPFSKTVYLWSKKHSIPSLHLLHNPALFHPHSVHTEQNSDILAINSEATYQALVNAGFDGSRLAVTGLPHLDNLAEQADKHDHWRAQICAWHKLQPNQPIVVYGTTWSGGYHSHLENTELATEVLTSYFTAIRTLGKKVQHIIKDRPGTGAENEILVRNIAAKLGVSPKSYIYVAEPPGLTGNVTSEKPLPYLLGADLVVATDSGLLLEAMSVGTRALNLQTDNVFVYGPVYAGNWGIRQCEAEALADSVLRTLKDENCLAEMRTALPHVNASWDGKATERFVALMGKMAHSDPQRVPYIPDALPRPPRKKPTWQRLNSPEKHDTKIYNSTHKELVDMSPRPIRCALEIGCMTGDTGAYIKEKFPTAKIIGIEQDPAAAAVARTRLDTVLVGGIDEIDFDTAGIRAGDIDTIFIADVLEHLYNPWSVLTRLQRYLSSDGQIIASIPNVRNLKLMEALSNGYWHYEDTGLLDITNIRFFTLNEVRRFFHETGYHIRTLRYGIDARLLDFHNANQDKPVLDVQFGRVTLNGVTQEELKELCSLQFYVVAQTGALAMDMELYRQIDPYVRYVAETRPALHEGILWEQHLSTWSERPSIEILLYDTSGDVDAVIHTISNLADQLYTHTVLTIISATPAPEGLTSGERLRWMMQEPGESILAAANRAITNSTADWIGRLFTGDKLEQSALLRLMELARRHPEARCLYTDDDTLLPENLSHPRFKPDFDPDLLLGWSYLDGLTLFQRTTLIALGGINESLRGAEITDLALKLHETEGAQAFAHLTDPACHRPATGNDNDLPGRTVIAARENAIKAHLERTGGTAKISSGWQIGTLRVERELAEWPSVSILHPVPDNLLLLQQTVESLLEKTDYPAFELLLLDNASKDEALRSYLESLDTLGNERIRVFTLPEAAPLSTRFNLLAAQAVGDVLVCLDAGCSPLSTNWLSALVAEAWRPEIGAVAPRLLDTEGKVVRSALIAGCGGTASDAFAGRALSDPGPDGRAHHIQRFSALPQGCLVLRSEVFQAAHGFDTLDIDSDLAALDLTLRITAAGLACLWNPYVSLLHQALAEACDSNEGKEPLDTSTLYTRHLPLLARDPAYHPALSMTTPPFQIEARHPLFKNPLPWRPLPKILATNGDDTGCGNYRIILPAEALNRTNRATVEFSQALYSIPELSRIAPDAIVLQRQLTDTQIARMEEIRKHFSIPVNYELDDLITNVPKNSVHHGEIPKDTAQRLERALSLVDQFTVTTEGLKEAYSRYHPRIRVLPNRLSTERWGDLMPQRKPRKRLRIGWGGSVSHTGDLLVIADVVRELAREVDWIFMGHCPTPLRPYIAEYHPGVPFDEYPETLASLDLDLAVAPLEHNQFNECKSNLKLLEYGILGYPVIATDIVTYQGDLPVTLVKNKFAHWTRAIREHIADRDALECKGQALREAVVSNWMLEDHLDDWLNAWTVR